MALFLTTELAKELASTLKTQLDAGFLYIMSGPVPANGNAAADVSCAVLVKISKDGDGVTGLTFTTPTTGELTKATAEVWTGDATAAGTATFYRFCESGDTTPLLASSGKCRIQGVVGSTPFSSDLIMSNTNLAINDAVPIAGFSYNVPEGA